VIVQHPSWIVCLHCGRSIATVAERIVHDGVQIQIGLPSKFERRWVGRWSRGHVGPLWHIATDPTAFFAAKLVHQEVTTPMKEQP